MRPTFEAAIIALVYGWEPVTCALTWVVPGYRCGEFKSFIPLTNCATAGTMKYFCLLCHKTGVFQTSTMDVPLYYPVFAQILQLLETVHARSDFFRVRLQQLRAAGEAVACLTPTANVYVHPLTRLFCHF
jgi:hypothetical protein